MIEYKVQVQANGDRDWYLNGNLHREDGPAVEYANGTKCWYLNDKRHRQDGPAVEYANGTKIWFLNDSLMTEQAWTEALSPTKEMTVEEISRALGYDIKVVKG